MLSNTSIFSFFAGAGFLDLGFAEQFKIDFVNEHDQAFLNAYKESRIELPHEEPIHGYSSEDARSFLHNKSKDLKHRIQTVKDQSHLVGFIAGPPCPDFSVAGKQRGRNGDKGALTETYFTLIQTFKPDFFLFENVPGLLRTKKHKLFFSEMLNLLHFGEAPYITTTNTLNARIFGVPQDRNRVFLLGFRPDLLDCLQITYDHKTREVPVGLFPWRRYAIFQEAQIDQVNWPTTDPFSKDSINRVFTYEVLEELTVDYWFETNKVKEHINQQHQFRPKALERFMTVPEGDISGKSFKRLHRMRYSPTAAYGNNEVHLHPYKARRISVAEALAIQSLPPEFKFGESYTLSQMFKMIGNGVPYLMAKGLAKSLYDFLERGADSQDA